MNIIDLAALCVILIFGCVGFCSGLSRIVLRAVLALVGFVSFAYVMPLTLQLLDMVGVEKWRLLVACLLQIVALVSVIEVIVWFFTKTRDALLLKLPDKILGGIAGVVTGCFFSLFSLVYLSQTSLDLKDDISNSLISRYVHVFTPVVEFISGQ